MRDNAQGWYLSRGGVCVGPVSTHQTLEGIGQGKIGADDLIGRSEKGPWHRVGGVRPFGLAFGPSGQSIVTAPLSNGLSQPASAIAPTVVIPGVFVTLGESDTARVASNATSMSVVVELSSELCAAIDRHAGRLRQELPGLAIDRAAAMRILIAKGLRDGDEP